MKRTILVISLCLLAGYSFGQKKAVKDAKSAMKNISEARELIKPALSNPETMNDPETWKLAGDIEYKSFDDQRTAEQLKEISGKPGANEEEMYTSLYNMYEPYMKADALSELPDEKGKIKNKVRKDVIKNIKDSYQFYINGGIFYNDKKDFKKATDFFERYWEIPSLEILRSDQAGFNTQDTIFQTIKYYATISAIQSQDHPRAIKLLNKMIAEPYIGNNTYKESDPYELLTSEYQIAEDSVSYVNTLAAGAKKFPKNQFFTPNLINEYIKSGNTQKALEFLDQAIANDRTNSCDLNSVKGSLFAEQKKYDDAKKAYESAFATDASCLRAQEGLGVLYLLLAQDVKDKASQTTNRKEQAELDKQTADLYLKSLPYLEKYRDGLKLKSSDSSEMRSILVKLQNAYYNLSLLKVDKSAELEAIDKELGAE